MFISTILMVVVLVVALSTATFAWYTANNQANTNAASVIAADSTSANIAIGWTPTATGTAIEFDTTQKTLDPMVPDAALAGEDAWKTMTYNNFKFSTASVDSTGTFGSATEGMPWTVSNAAYTPAGEGQSEVAVGTHTSFFVINHNVNKAVNVTMTCEIGAAADTNNNSRLLVAVFVGGTLSGIFTNLNEYTVGPVKGLASGLAKSSTGKVNEIVIPLAVKGESSDHYAEITVKAWLDGRELTQEHAKKTASFTFHFNGAVVG